MSTIELRREIKRAVDRLPAKRLDSVAEFLKALKRPPLRRRIAAARKDIAAGKGVNWRQVRDDV